MSGNASLLVHRWPGRVRRHSFHVIALVTALLAGLVLVVTQSPARAAGTLLSQGRPATASSTENAGTPASAAVDGNPGTRWSSAASDPQWLQVDLGAGASISQVGLVWEAAYATAFQIQVSDTGAGGWTTVYSTTTGTGGTQTLNVSGTGRYVRMYGTARATGYGYSLWEFQVYGSFTGGGGCGTANAALNRPVTASSTENAASPASAAVDGDPGTRWSSAFSDPQWLQVDLGTSQQICQVGLAWEAAYATAFQIQVSDLPLGGWTTVYSTTTGSGGTQTLNVSGTGRYVRMYGTARATAFGYSLWEFQVRTTGSGTGSPSPTPTSSGPSDPGSFWGDTGSIPAAKNVVMLKILNRTNGKYPDSQVYWSYNGQAHSIAEQPYFDMPVNSAGRMYFYLGSPNSQYYDFIEFTVGPNVFNGNTTRVDAFGLKLAMRLHAKDGYDVSVGEDQQTFAEDRSATFQKFANEVPDQFKVLAQTQAPYRIIAPGSDPSFRTGGVNANYFTAYANSVGVNAPTSDVFGCAGTLSESPGTCAALNRHVATLPQSQWSDPTRYYTSAPANYYAKFWHDHAINKLAYGFPYDDYAGQSSFISHGDPQYLLVAVGW
ncbi:discoidin domain-containing protein [Peterkaempfera bronchialis]|uniref:Coagulation factor 5/8 type domain-containing protein n=1 Tax=Peterkaempfera bronchialis TaxID=2126346 RepID=A0A345SXU2_9ACTN|nr:discoidin domain-containing protein [Peterkaempfera bronchialis]AXI78547.1 coagulation factor 5/8 type domain-containing protein [Peterkaempfera bronchialis]